MPLLCVSLADRSSIRPCRCFYISKPRDAESGNAQQRSSKPVSGMSGHGCSRSSKLVTPTADPINANSICWHSMAKSGRPACTLCVQCKACMQGRRIAWSQCVWYAMHTVQGAAVFGRNTFGRNDTAVRRAKGGLDLHQGLVSVAAQRTALIDVVFLHQRQQQHAINVANVQLLDLGGNLLTLMSVSGLAPGVQIRLHSWCNDLQAPPAACLCRYVGLLPYLQQ